MSVPNSCKQRRKGRPLVHSAGSAKLCNKQDKTDEKRWIVSFRIFKILKFRNFFVSKTATCEPCHTNLQRIQSRIRVRLAENRTVETVSVQQWSVDLSGQSVAFANFRNLKTHTHVQSLVDKYRHTKAVQGQRSPPPSNQPKSLRQHRLIYPTLCKASPSPLTDCPPRHVHDSFRLPWLTVSHLKTSSSSQ